VGGYIGAMSELARTRRSYDQVAARYAREIGPELAGKPLDRGLLDAVAELAGGGLVADIGCGPGHVAAYLARRGALVAGFDLSPAMCRVTRATGVPAGAGDLARLPIQSGALGGLVCLYAVIHLDGAARAAAYAEFARVLRPGGHGLISFHVSDTDFAMGGASELSDWWDHPVELTFRFLDPSAETVALTAAGLDVVARLDREPYAVVEHASRRCYLLIRRPAT
jgi:SAM-dependent methyltransferase